MVSNATSYAFPDTGVSDVRRKTVVSNYETQIEEGGPVSDVREKEVND